MLSNKCYDEEYVYFDDITFAEFFDDWSKATDELKVIYKKFALNSYDENKLSKFNRNLFEEIKNFYLNDPLMEYLIYEVGKISNIKIGDVTTNELNEIIVKKNLYSGFIAYAKEYSFHELLENIVSGYITGKFANIKERQLVYQLYRELDLSLLYDEETREEIERNFKLYGFNKKDE